MFVLLLCHRIYMIFFFFFFNDTATTEIYTLSLHDALPIWIRQILRRKPIGAILVEPVQVRGGMNIPPQGFLPMLRRVCDEEERKRTRLDTSHPFISYAVFFF